ncbi:MAG TPA: hypothetical protein VKW77_09315, partial [Acidimicrobiales bacterium]|nr:hypothetical protein [Acidimicrobiales bacterium]
MPGDLPGRRRGPRRLNEALIEEYSTGRIDLRRVAQLAGMTTDDARRALAAAGVPLRSRGRPRGRSRLGATLTADYLRREYLDAGRSAASIAAELGCDHKTVLRHIRLHGLTPRGRARPSAV